jgi:hypothetical protein
MTANLSDLGDAQYLEGVESAECPTGIARWVVPGLIMAQFPPHFKLNSERDHDIIFVK